MSILKRIQSGESQSPSPQNGSSAAPSSAPMQPRKPLSMGSQPQDTYQDLKSRVQNKLLSELDPSVDVTEITEVRKTIQSLFDQILVEENFVLSRTEKARLFDQIVAGSALRAATQGMTSRLNCA
mgnify:CR=1 FL=1